MAYRRKNAKRRRTTYKPKRSKSAPARKKPKTYKKARKVSIARSLVSLGVTEKCHIERNIPVQALEHYQVSPGLLNPVTDAVLNTNFYSIWCDFSIMGWQNWIDKHKVKWLPMLRGVHRGVGQNQVAGAYISAMKCKLEITLTLPPVQVTAQSLEEMDWAGLNWTVRLMIVKPKQSRPVKAAHIGPNNSLFVSMIDEKFGLDNATTRDVARKSINSMQYSTVLHKYITMSRSGSGTYFNRLGTHSLVYGNGAVVAPTAANTGMLDGAASYSAPTTSAHPNTISANYPSNQKTGKVYPCEKVIKHTFDLKNTRTKIEQEEGDTLGDLAPQSLNTPYQVIALAYPAGVDPLTAAALMANPRFAGLQPNISMDYVTTFSG